MIVLATITHKNQLTIPTKFIKGSELEGVKRVLLEKRGGEIILKPVKSKVEELAGSLNKYSFKRKSSKEIRRLEKEGLEKAIVERYKNKLKRQGNKLLVIKP